MNLKISAKKQFKNFIDRVHKNYQGQVAIFVALIFQIVFILFALMINVGLLIHHKINLQQSTDLAAYYGAMKQAEMLNVVGHVNFQIRQAFKLLTWRYRILGTFGVEGKNGNASPALPIYNTLFGQAGKAYAYDPASENSTCNLPGGPVGPMDIPFMCMAHYGFKEYPNPDYNSETFCKIDCGYLQNSPVVIPNLALISTTGSGGYGDSTTNSVNQALTSANLKIGEICKATGPTTLAQLVKFYVSYMQDSKNKMLFVKMLLANLSADEKDAYDIEGKKIFQGVENTFRNNLTEANNTSSLDGKDGNVLESMSSLSPKFGGDCSYSTASATIKSKDNVVRLFSEVNFQTLQYFITKCEFTGPPTKPDKEFGLSSIYANSQLDLNNTLKSQLTELYGATVTENIETIMKANKFDHTVGIEKNPWCPVYYGVKASTTPIIPFLPISKVKLHAVAFAKPFGGSVGPRTFKNWNSGDKKSDSTAGEASRTDTNLPRIDPTTIDFSSLSQNKLILLNYSNYVGDRKGLADTKVVAFYHDMLKNRIVGTGNFAGRDPESTSTDPKLTKPKTWPAYSEWDSVSQDISDENKYDPLAYDTINNKNSFMRDIELSVVAPNQFDATYYSIEPDFFNIYVKDKLNKSGVMDKLKVQAGINGVKVYIPKDFGHNNNISNYKENFSVRDQLKAVQDVIKAKSPSNPPTVSSYSPSSAPHSANMSSLSSSYFNYIPYSLGSLLTSWTMKDLVSDDFSVIPQDDTSMPFAKCDDEIDNDGYGSIKNSSGGSDPLPAAPGNCVSGGRTGYSVKIVSQASLFSDQLTIGNSTGAIANPPTGFISF